ncbi:MAG: cytidine/deoxycytidylate deaminase family protein [Candidatus Woesearchaeota archaeon]
MSKRISWDDYFIEIAKAVRERATCDRGRNGVVIVKNKQILSTGYVGSPPGMPHCDDAGHMIKKVTHEDGKETQHCLRTTHAEINSIAQAAKFGIALEGSTLYTLLEPCLSCAKAIINAGIKRVVVERKYHAAEEARELFKNANVELITLKDETVTYKDM